MGKGRTQVSHTPVSGRKGTFLLAPQRRRGLGQRQTMHHIYLPPSQLQSGSNLRSLLILNQRTREDAPFAEITPYRREAE